MKGLLLIVAATFGIGVTVLLASGTGAQEGDAQKPGDRFLAETAERLGVGVEELTGAMTDAQFEMIDEAVANDQITEEQAAKLKERIEEYGPLAGIGAVVRHRQDRPLRQFGECRSFLFVFNAAGQVLGMERKEVARAVQSGQTLLEIAESKGMSEDEFTSALLDQVKANLDKLVEEEKLTQEQAERIFAGIQDQIDEILKFHGQPGQNPCRHPGRGNGAPRGDRGRRAEGEPAPVQ